MGLSVLRRKARALPAPTGKKKGGTEFLELGGTEKQGELPFMPLVTWVKQDPAYGATLPHGFLQAPLPSSASAQLPLSRCHDWSV